MTFRATYPDIPAFAGGVTMVITLLIHGGRETKLHCSDAYFQ